ncbi:uncharacterized protein BDZ99DRAFT_180068 [Mytilinidion resinicola]|uniref:Uncharacterized protein n=1 Tax=Mytilinidion resinicola TaxID=574789 RepID=A0A6A6Z174_9PEZI|nr:uncharacterized protein BDZ99DRAFT_180068 [Mytilinidion resinicola]KAF2814548.1 hypothetical protein BDZ99DRAFT_180068 [Mytilinidion resinicola]
MPGATNRLVTPWAFTSTSHESFNQLAADEFPRRVSLASLRRLTYRGNGLALYTRRYGQGGCYRYSLLDSLSRGTELLESAILDSTNTMEHTTLGQLDDYASPLRLLNVGILYESLVSLALKAVFVASNYLALVIRGHKPLRQVTLNGVLLAVSLQNHRREPGTRLIMKELRECSTLQYLFVRAPIQLNRPILFGGLGSCREATMYLSMETKQLSAAPRLWDVGKIFE